MISSNYLTTQYSFEKCCQNVNFDETYTEPSAQKIWNIEEYFSSISNKELMPFYEEKMLCSVYHKTHFNPKNIKK